jgi:hypothetical protein
MIEGFEHCSGDHLVNFEATEPAVVGVEHLHPNFWLSGVQFHLMSEPMAMIFGVVSRLTGFPIMVLYP